MLQQELDKLVSEKKDRDVLVDSTLEKLKSLEKSNAKDRKYVGALEGMLEKSKLAHDDLQNKYKDSKAEVSRLKKELDSFSRQSKQTDQDSHSKDLRLNRALDEIEKLKHQISFADSQFKVSPPNQDKLDAGKRITEDLYTENKRLQKQKADILIGFKRQNQLIELLKRQKMHLEAAKLLSFTEQDFIKALNIQ